MPFLTVHDNGVQMCLLKSNFECSITSREWEKKLNKNQKFQRENESEKGKLLQKNLQKQPAFQLQNLHRPGIFNLKRRITLSKRKI